MEFRELVSKVGSLPCFTTGFLTAGESKAALQQQLSRWCEGGKVIQIRRGLYTLAEPYRKGRIDPFYVANAIKTSYVSLQSALAWWGLIPEHVPEVTSVTTGRPGQYQTPIGRFSYRRISVGRFWGSRIVESAEGFPVHVAAPAKALLDLVYLTKGGEGKGFLEGLRLQNLEMLDRDELVEFSRRMGAGKMRSACANILAILRESDRETEL